MQTITPRFVLQIPSLLSSCGEKYKRDGGYPHREDKTLSVPAHKKNYRFRTHQFLVSLLLVFVLGALVQVHKLSALDAAGREFQQTTTKDKTMFLVPFAIAKATSNLFSGSLANRFGRKRVGIVGCEWGILVRRAVIFCVRSPTTAAAAAGLGTLIARKSLSVCGNQRGGWA